MQFLSRKCFIFIILFYFASWILYEAKRSKIIYYHNDKSIKWMNNLFAWDFFLQTMEPRVHQVESLVRLIFRKNPGFTSQNFLEHDHILKYADMAAECTNWDGRSGCVKTLAKYVFVMNYGKIVIHSIVSHVVRSIVKINCSRRWSRDVYQCMQMVSAVLLIIIVVSIRIRFIFVGINIIVLRDRKNLRINILTFWKT